MFESIVNKPTNLDIEYQWKLFKNQYRSGPDSYKTKAEENYHFSIFVENYLKIVKHNFEYELGLHKYKSRINQFSDITDAEFYAKYTMNFSTLPPLPKNIKSFSLIDTQTIDPNRKLPKYFDWRDKNVINDIKNQGTCLSCWAFATISAFESTIAIKSGNLQILSEQQVIDCTQNYSCSVGNNIETAIQTIIINGGSELDKNYPYVSGSNGGKLGICKKTNLVGRGNLTVVYVLQNEIYMQTALIDHGPLIVLMHVNTKFISAEIGSIYESSDCNKPINHAVNIVGYGQENGKPYWIIRNSWGPKFNDKGYIKVLRGVNMCRIESFPQYIVF